MSSVIDFPTQPPQFIRVYERIFTVAICGIFMGTVLFLAWISDRGFDITDEGLYALGARYPDEIKASIGSSHIYGGVIFRAVGYDLQWFRLSGLFLVLCGSVVFSVGFRRLLAALLNAQVDLPSTAATVSFVGLGAMLFYSWSPPTPSYNLFVAFGVMAATGVALAALAAAENDRRKTATQYPALVVAGALLAFVFLAKFTAGVATGVVLCALVLVWPTHSGRLRLAIALLGGFAAWWTLHFAVLQSMDDWASTWRGGISLLPLLQSHGPSLVIAYVKEVASMLYGAVYYFLPLLTLVAAAHAFMRVRKPTPALSQRLIGLTFVTSSVLVIPLGYLTHMNLGGVTNQPRPMLLYVGCLLLIILTIPLHRISLQRSGIGLTAGSRILLLGVVLALLPFASAVGTNNVLPTNAILAMAPGFGLLLLAGLRSSQTHWNRLASYSLFLVIGIFAASQIISGNVVEPYRLNTGILEQNVPTEIGFPPTYVKLDRATSAFLHHMRTAASEHGMHSGDDVLALVRLPGVVFALGGKSPGIPWYTSGYAGAREYNEAGLAMTSPERLRHAFILESTGEPEAMPDLTKFNVNLRTQYDQVGEAIWPLTKSVVRLWKRKTI